MKLLLDSANIDDIRRIANTDAIAGVTTNPSLMAKEEKGDYHKKLLKIGEALFSCNKIKHLSVEVITLDTTEMIRQAIELSNKFVEFDNVDLFIKIPVTLDNLAVISKLEDNKIKVNATACMNSSQAKMAIDAGASIVSYFYNRIKDGGEDDPGRHIKTTAWYANKSDIICGSIRKVQDIYDCWSNGADYVTAPMKIIEEMISHPQTDIAIEGFQRDIEAWLK